MPNSESEPRSPYEVVGKRIVQAAEFCISGLATVILARTALNHAVIEPIIEGIGWGVFAGSLVAGPAVVTAEMIKAHNVEHQQSGQQG